MGNIVETLKRFISNKNTVTILAVLAGVIILWWFYNKRVEEAITTIKVPYAIKAVDSTRKIDSENIGYKEITRSSTEESDIITNITELNDKYVCAGQKVPKDGFFYKTQVCENKEIPNSILQNLKDGYAPYTLSVTSRDTYANSILPDDYIDIYMSATSEDGGVIWGRLIESIQVLAVRDSAGKDVFWDSTAGDTAMLIFAVPEKVEGEEDLFTLLQLTELVNGYAIKLVPVIRGASYTQNPGETAVDSHYLRDFIMRNYVEPSY